MDFEMDFELDEITDKIYLLRFEHRYDLAMHFLRAQEYYESNNPVFRRHAFTILDYMEWYAKYHNGVFSYPDDWAGFNVPGWVFQQVLDKRRTRDWNKYDDVMRGIVDAISKQYNRDERYSFYLIGTACDDPDTFDHELAHAFYATEPKYKTEMDRLLATVPDGRRKYSERLEDMGYDRSVLDDECQAYFATTRNPTIGASSAARFKAVLTRFKAGAWTGFDRNPLPLNKLTGA